MAAQCKKEGSRQIHHRNRYRPATRGNAELLCDDCHEKTNTYGKDRNPSKPKDEYPQELKDAIRKERRGICECTRENCH